MTEKKVQSQYSFLLLAGGKSSRMGKDKGELTFHGKSFLACQLEKAKRLRMEACYLSGHAWKETGVHVVADRFLNRGPLGGIHACMKEMKTPYCLVLPVDVPQLPVEALESLLLFHMKKDSYSRLPLLLSHGERVEPLMGIYPVEMAEKIEELILEHSIPVFRALDAWGYETFPVNLSSWETENINTPEDYQKLLEFEKRGTEQ